MAIGPGVNFQDFWAALSRKQISGALQVSKYGRRLNAVATEASVSTIPVAVGPYPWNIWDALDQAVGSTVVVSSANDGDKPVLAGGTGASEVTLIGLLNGRWQFETIILDGTAPVNSAKKYTAAFRAYVSGYANWDSAGLVSRPLPNAVNLGTITFTVGGTAVLDIRSIAGRTFNQSLTSHFTVPHKYQCLVKQIDISQANTSGKLVDVGLMIRKFEEPVFRNQIPVTAGTEGINSLFFGGAYVLDAGSDVELRCTMESASTSIVNSLMDLYLIPVDSGVKGADIIPSASVLGAVL